MLLVQEVLAALQDCQQVVCLEDIFEDSQWVYIVQELCEGGDLAQALTVSSSPGCVPGLCSHRLCEQNSQHIPVMSLCLEHFSEDHLHGWLIPLTTALWLLVQVWSVLYGCKTY